MTADTQAGSSAAQAGSDRSNRRWLVLGAGVFAQTATCMFQFGVPYLLPRLRVAAGGSLLNAALLVACPSIGLVLALIAWGAFADRRGEPRAMIYGLIGAAIILGVAGTTSSTLALGACLIAAGAMGAGVSAASGRAILGWFGPHERGLAMGVRQTGQPIGVGAAALVLPAIANNHGYAAALWAPAIICLVAAVFVILAIIDPPHVAGTDHAPATSPYRKPELWFIHLTSALLVVPQFTIAAFAFVYLVDVHHWSAGHGGALLAATQIAGAAARLAAGQWSDRIADRLGPVRLLAVVTTVVVGLLAGAVALASPASPVLLVLAAIISVSTNGLNFTAVAEIAGRAWSGRALGAQNTVQNIAAAITPPLLGLAITSIGYAGAFGIAAAFAAAAIPLVPHTSGAVTWGLRANCRRSERRN